MKDEKQRRLDKKKRNDQRARQEKNKDAERGWSVRRSEYPYITTYFAFPGLFFGGKIEA
ncbi:hypothetical protein [Nocardia sp.]|uniref:hypothetical protein n=1 Tax=Nocardia sp. TaxID=1821 RepID=UPI00260BEEB3|nr:hypothetical protein [Nocardia sp.]